jgi:hypothetical protein
MRHLKNEATDCLKNPSVTYPTFAFTLFNFIFHAFPSRAPSFSPGRFSAVEAVVPNIYLPVTFFQKIRHTII